MRAPRRGRWSAGGSNETCQTGSGFDDAGLLCVRGADMLRAPVRLPIGAPEAIAVAAHHVCVREGADGGAGGVACWGANGSGQANPADGGVSPSSAPARVALTGAALDLSAGAARSCAVVGEDAVCWGNTGRTVSTPRAVIRGGVAAVRSGGFRLRGVGGDARRPVLGAQRLRPARRRDARGANRAHPRASRRGHGRRPPRRRQGAVARRAPRVRAAGRRFGVVLGERPPGPARSGQHPPPARRHADRVVNAAASAAPLNAPQGPGRRADRWRPLAAPRDVCQTPPPR